MSTDRLAQLETLSTEELRERAFALARQRRDLSFFWGLFTHVPHGHDDSHDGWLGSLAATIDDAVGLWHEVTEHTYGESEPLVRAAFIDYLSSPQTVDSSAAERS
jgi:hypothetical protein